MNIQCVIVWEGYNQEKTTCYTQKNNYVVDDDGNCWRMLKKLDSWEIKFVNPFYSNIHWNQSFAIYNQDQ